MSRTILTKVIAVFVIPSIILFAVFSVVIDYLAKQELETALGTRLKTVAGAAATHIRIPLVSPLVPGMENSAPYSLCQKRLRAVANATQVARIYVFDANYRSLCDTNPNVPIHTQYHKLALDTHELQNLFATGTAQSSLLFEGEDGKQYKSGYAAVNTSDTRSQLKNSEKPQLQGGASFPSKRSKGGTPPGAERIGILEHQSTSPQNDRWRARPPTTPQMGAHSIFEMASTIAVGVDAPATYFSQLSSFRTTLVGYGAGMIGVVLFLAILFAAFVTRPIRDLTRASANMGKGDLLSPIRSRSRDEIGTLAQIMESMRQNLSARDEHMQMMLAGIAHEIRNPLAGIALFAGILRSEISSEDPKQAHVQKIEKELAYLQSVVNEFLDYAKRDSLETREIFMHDMITEVIALAQADANALKVSLSHEIPPCTIQGNPNIVRRILLNLIKNALQASSETERAYVRVSARPSEKQLIVDVWNNGPAIPKDVQKSMFQPFFTTKDKGTGLGLAFVRQALIDYGGEIRVTSNEEHGTTFSVLFSPLDTDGNDSSH